MSGPPGGSGGLLPFSATAVSSRSWRFPRRAGIAETFYMEVA